CSVIRFDDSEHDLSVRTTVSGDEHIVFSGEEIVQRLFLDYELKDTLPALPNLSKSASDGCVLCCIFKEQITLFLGHKVTQYTELFIHKLCYSMHNGDGDEVPQRSWLQSLNMYFKLVDVNMTEASHSLRLEIQADPTADYLPIQEAEGRRYIALSYCWGPPEKAKHQLKTETSTLKNRLQQIPFLTLPKIHQDSVRICRALGVRYLWIDSLCIIQDDKADWDHEAERMGNVYANAYLTICAARGDSCLDSFLDRIIPTNVVTVPFVSSINPSISGTFSIFPSPRTHGNFDTDRMKGKLLPDFFRPNPPPPDPYRFAASTYQPYNQDVLDCSWNRRGWTYQETLLSPRALVFGELMVYACAGGDLIESEDDVGDNPQAAVRHFLWKQEKSLTDPESEILDDWRTTISSYTSRSLTYRNDTLPALSALAQKYAARVNCEYLAGLFSANLHRGLLWTPGNKTNAAEFLKPLSKAEYIAPSWSWASRSGGSSWVWHIRSSFKREFQLMESNIELDGSNKYGRVKSGHLLLSTKMCQIPTNKLRHNPQFVGASYE
ncbi:unnamed protein product, partial [Clonostachys byssicola]